MAVRCLAAINYGMNILDQSIENKIQEEIIPTVLKERYLGAAKGIGATLGELYAHIPDNKLISYGIVHTIKVLSEYLFTHLEQAEAPVYEIAVTCSRRAEMDAAKASRWASYPSMGLGITQRRCLISRSPPLPKIGTCASLRRCSSGG